MLHPYDLEGIPKEKEELPKKKEEPQCKHPIPDRRIIKGENDFQQLKHIKCSGSNPVITNIDGNGGTHCRSCAKMFCGSYGCMCKSI